MQIERLPTSPTDTPALLGAYDRDNNVVKWLLDDDGNYQRDDFGDETNWFQVYRVNDVIHVVATQWYHPRGDFAIRVTDIDPSQAVALADASAIIASEYMNGDTKLEKTS